MVWDGSGRLLVDGENPDETMLMAGESARFSVSLSSRFAFLVVGQKVRAAPSA